MRVQRDVFLRHLRTARDPGFQHRDIVRRERVTGRRHRADLTVGKRDHLEKSALLRRARQDESARAGQRGEVPRAGEGRHPGDALRAVAMHAARLEHPAGLIERYRLRASRRVGGGT